MKNEIRPDRAGETAVTSDFGDERRCKKLDFYFLPIFRQSSPLPVLQPALIRADRQGLLLRQVERSKG